MYLLGSQKLTVLRDAISCINDAYVHKDMSEKPDKKYWSSLPLSVVRNLFKNLLNFACQMVQFSKKKLFVLMDFKQFVFKNV